MMSMVTPSMMVRPTPKVVPEVPKTPVVTMMSASESETMALRFGAAALSMFCGQFFEQLGLRFGASATPDFKLIHIIEKGVVGEWSIEVFHLRFVNAGGIAGGSSRNGRHGKNKDHKLKIGSK